MADKSSVEGNRVTIETWGYDVKSVGGGKYEVTDMFGGKLGFFKLNGQQVIAEDWGIPDAHPVEKIGKLWVASQKPKTPTAHPGSKMVCAVATYPGAKPDDLKKARAYRAWLAEQPGFRTAIVTKGADKLTCMSVWKTRKHFDALASKAPAEATLPAHTSLDVLSLIEDV